MLKSDRPNQFEFESERHRVCPHQNDLEISNRFQNRNRWLPPPPHQFIKNSKVEKRRRLAIFGVELFKRSHGRSVVAKKQNKTKKKQNKTKKHRPAPSTRPRWHATDAVPYSFIDSSIHSFLIFGGRCPLASLDFGFEALDRRLVDIFETLRTAFVLFCFRFSLLPVCSSSFGCLCHRLGADVGIYFWLERHGQHEMRERERMKESEREREREIEAR